MNKILFFALILCGSFFSACSEEGTFVPNGSDNQIPDEGKSFLTISLILPEESEIRSQTNMEGGTGETEVAGLNESKVSDAWVFLGEIYPGQQVPIKISQRYFVEGFKWTGNPAHWTATIPCNPGRYRIAIVANPDPSILVGTLPDANWDALARAELDYKSYDDLKRIWDKNHFMMTNAFRGRNNDNDVVLEIGRNTYKDVYVQRTCARFDYEVAKADNIYEVLDCMVDGEKYNLNVQLESLRLINVSKNFNLFKMVVPDVQPGRVPDFYQFETQENYVYDSDWQEKWNLQYPGSHSDVLASIFCFPSERSRKDNTPTMGEIKLPVKIGKNRTVTYASENTLPGVLAQINKLSTGVVFKGKFNIGQTKTVFYRELSYGKELYSSEEKLREALHKESIILPLGKLSDEVLAKLGILKFTADEQGNFPVYYTYWNRHNDNVDPNVMGNMEFAVVRNNVYKLKVNSISSLGLPLAPDDPNNPWKPDGDTPDEQLPQIDVTVDVSDWVSRKMEHEI